MNSMTFHFTPSIPVAGKFGRGQARHEVHPRSRQAAQHSLRPQVDWLTHWLTHWLTDSLTHWLTDSLIAYSTKWMHFVYFTKRFPPSNFTPQKVFFMFDIFFNHRRKCSKCGKNHPDMDSKELGFPPKFIYCPLKFTFN